jgi:O-antigen/teichoic acid export membrane protein
MNMTGNSKVLNKVIVFSTLINVVLNILLIPVFGIDGAAFSSLVSTVLWNVVLTVFIHRKYSFFIGFNPFLLFKL